MIEILALIDALVGMEDWDALRRFLPEARDVAAQLALASPAIDRAEGLASAAAGDVPRAVELLRRAVDGFDPLSPFEAARTREALAAVDPEGRDELLSAARATYEQLGARAARCSRAFGHCCLGSHWPVIRPPAVTRMIGRAGTAHLGRGRQMRYRLCELSSGSDPRPTDGRDGAGVAQLVERQPSSSMSRVRTSSPAPTTLAGALASLRGS